MWTNCSGTILLRAILREEEKSKKEKKNWKVVEYPRRPKNKSFHVGDYSNYKKHGQKWKMHVQSV